ncbi:MAG: 50S ribosomal protein L9 [Candidatus Gastranaerophilales bacterium]|nr:50S ribosomal protein L9 [Candidatus Gastranaerophilales bacterium]
MKVILKKDVQALGEAGDVIEVADGFARNFLLPNNNAEVATEGALKNRQKNLARIKAKTEKLHQEALEKANKIQSLGKIEISAKAGETGKLFGAVTTRKLAEVVLEKTEIEIDRRNISLDKPINQVGQYKMNLKLTSKVEVDIPVVVIASEVLKEQEMSIIEEEKVEEKIEETSVE